MGGIMDEKDVLRRFRHQKVFTIEELVGLLQCSVITARRRLKKWKSYTSFNMNGRYYTLPKVPQFDNNGVWKYQSILFSKYGNLKQTIIQLVAQSKAGLSARELTGVVRLPSNSSFFSKLQDFRGIRREKYQGRFVYFSEEPEIYIKQKQQRTLHREGAISDADVVVILTALIRYHDMSIEDIMALPEVRERNFSPLVIREFLDHHGLLKKNPSTKS